MRRKHPPLDVVNMFSTLTMEHWKHCLTLATKGRNIEKLVAWRYGLQSGLTDAINKGVKIDKLDHWVIKRCRDLEKCMRYVLKQKYPDPKFDPKKDPKKYIQLVKETKKRRDLDFENFLRRSSF